MMASAGGYLFVQYGSAYVEVSLDRIERGTQLTEAAYNKLGLELKGVALVDVQLFCTVDGVRAAQAIGPFDTGDRLPPSGSILEAVLLPVASAGDAGA